MTLKHTDPHRAHDKYCNASCPLCLAAAHMQLTKEPIAVADSEAIRAMRPGQIVDVEKQSRVVRVFLYLAGVPWSTPLAPTDAVDPARDP